MAIRDAKTPRDVLAVLRHDNAMSDEEMDYVDGVFVSSLDDQVDDRWTNLANGWAEYTLWDGTRIALRQRPDGTWGRWIEGDVWP